MESMLKFKNFMKDFNNFKKKFKENFQIIIKNIYKIDILNNFWKKTHFQEKFSCDII